MASKDIATKNLEAYNDVFADIVNFFLFKGRQVVNPDDLQDTQLQNQLKIGSELHEENRDVSKYWGSSRIRITFLGLENQIKVDKDMPLRVMAYDGEAYKGQLLSKEYVTEEEKRYPVVTLVLYFGLERWKRWRSLYECIDVPEELKEYINDYKIHVFEVAYLSMEDVKLFKSDFKHVVDYLVQKRIYQKYVPSVEKLAHVDEILKLMEAITNKEITAEKFCSNKRRPENMCEIIQGFINEGKEQGRKEMQAKVDEAKAQTINLAIGMHEQGISDDVIAKAAKVSIETVREWLKGKLI